MDYWDIVVPFNVQLLHLSGKTLSHGWHLNSAVAGAEKWHLRVCLIKFKCYNLRTNLIEQSPSSEANNSLVSHDILHISTLYYQQIA